MNDYNASLPPHLLEATEALAETVLHSEAVVAFQRAKAALDAAPESRRLLDDLFAAQADLRRRQARSDVTRAALERMHALQTSAQADALIVTYASAQKAALAFLPTVNQQISELLGLNYATFARTCSC